MPPSDHIYEVKCPSCGAPLQLNLVRTMIFALSCLFLLIAMTGCNRISPQSPPAYGTKVRYTLNQPLAFPDLTLEFIGERKVDTSPQFPRGFIYYDFIIRQDDQEQIISWSEGTGDIGPTSFEIGRQRYLLERIVSDELGPLAGDELVLWQENMIK